LPGWLASLEPTLPASAIARQVGVMSGLYMLGVFVGALAAGFLSDWVGRGPVLLVGLSLFLAVLLTSVHVESLGALYALRFLAGLFGSAVFPVSAALIADGSMPVDAPRRLASLGAASLLGFLIGPALVSLPSLVGADVRWGIAGPVVLLAFAMHVALGVGVLVVVAATRVWRAERQVPLAASARLGTNRAGRSPFLGLLLLNFAILLGLGGFEVALALYGSQRLQLNALQISLMYAECSIVMLLINGVLFFTPLWRYIPLRLVLVVSVAAMVSGYLLLSRGMNYGSVLAAVALIAAGSGVAMPTITYTTANSAARVGAAMGQLTAAGSLGQAIGSFAGGWAFALLSTRTFLLGAAFMTVALLFAWVGIRGLAAVPAGGEARAPTQRGP
jgi:MFS family permease